MDFLNKSFLHLLGKLRRAGLNGTRQLPFKVQPLCQLVYCVLFRLSVKQW
jgi:hypothetical protein